MKKLLMLTLPLLLSVSAAWAQDTTQAQEWLSNIAFGTSVPTSSPNWNIQPQNTSFEPGGGPSRKSGGEQITIQFVDPNTFGPASIALDSVSLIGFSASGSGSVLVRSVSSSPEQPAHFFDPLMKSLNAEKSARVAFPQPTNINTLSLTLEGFANDDASVVVQFIYSGSNPKVTEWITRPSVNPPTGVPDRGGAPGCYSSIQCSSLQNCIGGQCVDVSNHDCRVSAADACGPGESCCGGKCVSGSCN